MYGERLCCNVIDSIVLFNEQLFHFEWCYLDVFPFIEKSNFVWLLLSNVKTEST